MTEAQRRLALKRRQIEARRAALSQSGEGKSPGVNPPQAEKSFWQTVKENVVGDDDPKTQNTGEKIGSFLNKAGEAMTFGLIGDEASAAVESIAPGVDYADRRDHYRQQEEILERDNPGAALAAEFGGAMALPGGALAKAGGGLAKRAMLSGLTTGAGSGIYGFSEGEGGAQDRLSDAGNAAKWGGVIGTAIPVVGAGVQRITDTLARNKAIRGAVKGLPDKATRDAQARAAYDAVDNTGVEVTEDAFGRLRSDISDALRARSSYTPRPGGQTITPKTYGVVRNMDDMAGEMAGNQNPALPFREIDSLRRQTGAAIEGADKQAAAIIREKIDDFVNKLSPDDIARGDVEALPGLISKARELWSLKSKDDMLGKAIDKAENYRWGVGNGIKFQFKRILNNDKLSRGLSDSEKALMKRVINGSVPERILELMGSGLTTIGGTVGGILSGNPVMAVGALLGSMAARKGSDELISRNADIVRSIIASGRAPALPAPDPTKARIIEQLMRRGTVAGVQ